MSPTWTLRGDFTWELGGKLNGVLFAIEAYSRAATLFLALWGWRELAMRVALGARASDVLHMVLRQSMMPIAGGLAIGLLGAFASTRLARVHTRTSIWC